MLGRGIGGVIGVKTIEKLRNETGGEIEVVAGELLKHGRSNLSALEVSIG